eukprot:Partr_v1_DN28395_c2_g1_i1_m78458 putative eukaryotic translation initiation factor 2c
MRSHEMISVFSQVLAVSACGAGPKPLFDPKMGVIVSFTACVGLLGDKSVRIGDVTFPVRIDELMRLSISDLIRNGANLPGLAFLDNALRLAFSSRSSLVLGDNIFPRDKTWPLGAGVTCALGHYQKLTWSDSSLFLNVDMSAVALHEAANLADLARMLFCRSKKEDRMLTELECQKLSMRLTGLRFSICHRGDMRKRYNIKGVTALSASQIMIRLRETDTEEISVSQYFRQRYFSLHCPRLPCVFVEKGGKVLYFPLEVCELVAGQKFRQKLNEGQTAKMIELTLKNPSDRKSGIISKV